MAARLRKTSSLFSRRGNKSSARNDKRQRLLETLEPRQLLAGPQLIGIQPNEGDLIVDGSVLDIAPRALTFKFDEGQAIDPSTFDGIRVTRAGDDGELGTDDDIELNAGLVTLGDSATNEVVVRFSDALPDDQYNIDVFGFDDGGLGITGLRNVNGELLVPRTPGTRQDSTTFTLRLGAQIEAVVPQPVVRTSDGSLVQNRNEIVVYFNEDPLFVENDGDGIPTERSAENPRFYQLFLTQDTVRTTDDALYHPDEVIYDPETHTARLIFSDDINELGPDEDGISGVPLQGGTFRLRIGTAVDDRVDVVLPPLQTPVAPSASTDFGIDDLVVTFVSQATGEDASGLRVEFVDSGTGGLSVATDGGGTITYDFGGTNPRVIDLRTVTQNTPAVTSLIDVRWSLDGVAGAPQAGAIVIPNRAVGSQPLTLSAVGDTLATALDVGVFRSGTGLTSLIFSESIDPQPTLIELLGGNDDPGRPEVLEIENGGLGQFINEQFGMDGADITDGVTEIPYNFRGIYATSGSQSFINQIDDQEKARTREALAAWSAKLGIQFRETVDEGITFAVGDPSVLPNAPGTVNLSQFNLAVRIDPTFTNSILVLDNDIDFDTAYGEDYFRRTVGGIGLLIGLEQAPGLPAQTVMAANPAFFGASINVTGDLEPVFPGNYDVLHGQHLYRPDSNDVDLYRFEVNLGDEDQVGKLTAETFAERLPDSSLLDTSITLFQEVNAFVESDLQTGSATTVRFDALASGRLGNNTRIDFKPTTRSGADNEIRISQPTDSAGNPITNGILIDVPRRSTAIPTVTVGEVIDAINNDPFASSLVRASLVRGSLTTDISGSTEEFAVLLAGGAVERLNRNDDYFSEDSRLVANLGAGVYYVGVAASGNETYDPTITGSGFGGRTQGRYDLHLKFEPQVDETDVLRDLDSDRDNVPGTPLDGDADGVPGGVHNFWFQTRSLNRQINFTSNGAGITQNQTFTVVGGNGIARTFEFVLPGQSTATGNFPVIYNDGSSGTASPSNLLARELRNAINSRTGDTGVTAVVNGSVLELTGDRSIELSDDFRGADIMGRNIFVDKTASALADGSLNRPFDNIANSNFANAFDSALPGDIVRIVGNGGDDGNLATEADNFSYQVGVAATGGATLRDGRNMEVPQGVTTMIDAGAIIKFRTSRIGVGSSTLLEDRSGGALQVLGTPRLIDLDDLDDEGRPRLIGDTDASSPDYSDGAVILTSIKDAAADAEASGSSINPAPGDWGGLVFRRDLDRSEGRTDLEDEGIFLQHVNHAQIRYGGGSNVLIDSVQQLVNPVQIFELRPSVTFNEISFSADAAISASPDSFEETSFQSPRFQQGGSFTADYSRIGPEIHDNRLIDNSLNGLFVRVTTTPGQPPRALTTSGRFDDSDVVHYFSQNITISGTPGGSIQDEIQPDLIATSFVTRPGGTLVAGTYDYRMTFVDASGFESLPSDASPSVTVATNSSVQLLNLTPVPADSDYLSRRLYRLDPTSGDYALIATLDSSDNDYLDNGSATQGTLDETRTGVRARLDASLVIDPGTVLKFRGTRLELGPGTQLLAEGTVSQPIIFTSYADDRFGSGGTFDTNNDRNSPTGNLVASPGDWSGIYAGPQSTVSLDNATVAFGGGISLLEGGQGRGFAALELQQAEGRVTNSRFEFNDDAQAGSGPAGRFGRLTVTPATIFVRGSQPTIVGNVFDSNDGSIIDIDSDSMGANRQVDLGRQTGPIERFATLDDNFGPLIRLNRYAEINPAAEGTQFSGLEIRGGVLAGPSVWDDTDIPHLLFDSITVDNIHSDGGLRLLSRSDESLVVKFTGPGSPYDDRFGTGLIATGTLGNAADRIGGSLHVVGLPGFPVVLTSFQDDSVGAGLTPQGTAFTDSNGDGIGSRAFPNDWRGILLEQNSNDRNVDFILEQTISNEVAPGLNGTVTNAQVLGALARDTLSGSADLRLGFEVEGLLSEDADIDTYSFTAEAGTQIWVDIDNTSLTLDTVIEILDADGEVLARSDNSFDEVSGEPPLTLDDDLVTGSLQLGLLADSDVGAGGLYKDYGSNNLRDAGIRLFLPGNPGTRSVYFFRVRSASVNPDDATGGITAGGYRFQVRLQEEQEFPGSVLRYTDIRYANHGIHARGQGDSSPFLGDAQEDEGIPAGDRVPVDNSTVIYDPQFPNRRAQYIGNLLQSENRSFSIGGALASGDDVDFYRIDVIGGSNGLLQASTVFDIDYAAGLSRPDTSLVVFYDRDGEDGPLPPELVLIAEDSNVIDDQGKPVSSANIDLLTRGSISTGDPLIGPVSLSEGTYFVGVVGAGAVPAALANINARREPLESILRIFEDRVDTIGGATALPPREGEFFDRAALPAGWSITTDRALTAGHGLTDTFNSSRNQSSTASVQNENDADNDTFATATDLRAAAPIWSLAADGNIGDETTNTSSRIPHTTVRGSLRSEAVDIYQFVVDVDGSRVILDIDNGFDPELNAFDPAEGTFEFDETNVDTQLYLLDDSFAQLELNLSELVGFGQGGSVPQTVNPDANPFDPILSDDPFISTVLDAGTYYVAVAREGTAYNELTQTFTFLGGGLFRFDAGDYDLHVSVANHPNGAFDTGNQSYFFDRSEPVSELISNPFDLTGYSAADLPRFYFNYYFGRGSTSDTVVVEATSDSTSGYVPLSDASILPAGVGGDQFRQSVASLADFAGHENVRIRFTYQAVGTGADAEGLYLDDLIVGFAERGEMISGSGFDTQSIVGGSTVAGEYQLEVRPGTEHGAPRQIAANSAKFDLNRTFDTNDRHVESAATIVAPHVDQIADGDSFSLSDGIREIRFEFDFDPTPNITSGNIRIPVVAGISQAEVADAIRTAINLPVVQSAIRIQASDSSGNAGGGNSGVTIPLTGLLIGDFLAIDSAADLPASGQPLPGGSFQLPVIFSEGVGDSNVERAQSQLILDSNKISDVFGIGIWNRFAERVQDPRDNVIFDLGRRVPLAQDDTTYILIDRDVNHATPRLGPTAPGGVRNLPTLNSSVLGGITPGVVIVNNTVDQAGYAGIKVDGQTQPYVIDSPFEDFRNPDDEDFWFGNFIADGLVMDISAAGRTVRFEFEDISGGAIPEGGSGTAGGDGWTSGHIPIYYRQSSNTYYVYAGSTERGAISTRTEVMWSIYQSILGSPLVTNGLVELVEPAIGPSRLYSRFGIPDTVLNESEMLPAVYVEGASNITYDRSFQKRNFSQPFDFVGDDRTNQDPSAPIYVAPQTFARVVNNTIYGKDGLSSSYFEPGTQEPNDLLSSAVDTRQGSDHGPLYQTFGEIGDGDGTKDVDFYEVELGLGDRLTVDIDTLPDGPNTHLRLFDARGVEVAASAGDLAPGYLNDALVNPLDPETPFPDVDDPAAPNNADPFIDFTATEAGSYYVAISSQGNENFDPLTVSGRVNGSGGTGVYGVSVNVFAPRNFAMSFDAIGQVTNFNPLIGTTFTVVHVQDVDDTPDDSTDNRNTTVYEFVDDDLVDDPEPPQNPDHVAIPIFSPGNTRIPAIMRSIAATLRDPDLDPETGLDTNPRDSDTVRALALGGVEGNGPGLITFDYTNRDFNGWGHDLNADEDLDQPGTTETFVWALRIADLVISDEATAAGLRLGHRPDTDAQAGIPEAGLVTTLGSSATVMNNVFANLDTSRIDDSRSLVIVSGNLSQDDTNDSIAEDDFNFNLPPEHPLFDNADGNRLLPGQGSFAIDSAINSVIDRNDLRDLRTSVGLPNSNLLAPNRDINGVLRADDPDVAPPGGLGGSVFKDRGSNELADFIGPVAIADTPQDNDSLGVDIDTSTSYIRLSEGSLDEFRIQLRDTGDASDPFAGLGIDDDTVVVAAIPGLRPAGANVTLFQDEELLVEGIDYSFSYDETQNVITLTPLAGQWENERAYRIELNNRSRTVLVAPSASQVADGNQISITDENGGTIVFEFESGYSLLIPEPITLVVPQVGTNAGGLRDGDIFTINDGENDPVIFEFDLDGTTLPDSVSVTLPSRPTPSSTIELQAFLDEIAENVRVAIAASSLDVEARRIGNEVVVGADAGAFANTTLTALDQLARTLALQVPTAGLGPNGISEGDTFVIGAGDTTVTYEFDTDGALNNNNNLALRVPNNASAEQVAVAIRDAVANLGIGFDPLVLEDDRTVYLNLPSNGSVSVPAGRLAAVGISRTLTDGDTIVLDDGSANPPTFEFDMDPAVGDSEGVGQDNFPILFSRTDTASELAARIVARIQDQTIAGLDQSGLSSTPDGIVTIGGQTTLDITTTGDGLEVIGSPAVATQSTIAIQGPVELTFSPLGGAVIDDGTVLVLQDNQGDEVVFEFNETGTAQIVPNAINVGYDRNDTETDLANALVAAVNGSTAGITASIVGVGQVSFGQVDPDRVSNDTYVDPDSEVEFDGVNAIIRQGLVMDGEILTIQQGDVIVNFEFESSENGGGVGLNNVPVVFQPGSEIANVADSLAAAINNNGGGLVISASVGDDGIIALDDRPGTIIDASQAPTLRIGGVPGGAIPIQILPGFGATEVKQALIDAINSVNRPGQPAVTTLSATDRGGATLFVAGGTIFDGPVESYALPAIADVVGNPLEPNRDLTTQFTILMPNVGLDYGDAPDPFLNTPGQYPTRSINDGPRHVVDDRLYLGDYSEADLDGIPSVGANGDDQNLIVTTDGALFNVNFIGGNAEISLLDGVDPSTRDGDTITIETSVSRATLEFDTDGLFDEDNFAVQPVDLNDPASVMTAIAEAISESPLQIAGATPADDTITIIGDDEDGVDFTSDLNPLGVLNASIAMPIDVTVTGGGILEAWIDFNGNGDFTDPGDQIIPMDPRDTFADRRLELCPDNLNGIVSNIFSDTGEAETRSFCIVVPPAVAAPEQPLTTYARFRVSREGDLGPTGLALSGEVEDYALPLLPGTPPTVGVNEQTREFSTDEEQRLQVLDATGSVSPANDNDNGLLVGIDDPDGNNVRIFADDTGDRVLMTPSGVVAGNLNVVDDGTFTFQPVENFNGTVEFQVRVTDVQPGNPATALVSPTPITVSITVNPVNDRPEATDDHMTITREVPEDQVQTFAASELIGDMYVAGPENESDQVLIVQSAGSSQGQFTTELGGTLSIASDGLSVVYTPPADYNGAAPDSFTYVVADQPAAGQTSLTAVQIGTVTMNFTAVNDPPRTTSDTYSVEEGQTLTIPVNGTPSAPGILDNDSPGPSDEIGPPQNQTIELTADQFPTMTDNNGTVALSSDGTQLIYTPAPFFSGIDRFEYSVTDRVDGQLGATATEEVLINVGGVNDSPVFVGVQGNSGQSTIVRDEAKVVADTTQYELGTWFNDPDGDALTYTVSSDNLSVANPTVNGDSLTIEFPPYGFGTATLTVTASDGLAAPTSQLIGVAVNNTPDAPEKDGTLDPQAVLEDGILSANLSDIFSDPDRETLNYAVARLDNIISPTAEQIANHPLVRSIDFASGQIVVQLEPDQSGFVDIEISATDSTNQQVTDSFRLTVSPQPDAPVATADGYNVPIGSVLRILNSTNGLLRNDFDADGDSIRIALNEATMPTKGSLDLNDDGTFVYTNTGGTPGEIDSFTYHVIDTTSRISETVTVTLTLNESEYQNPLTDLNADVNADGSITAIDALRVINFLGRRSAAQVPVADIGTPPPDYYDANGDGRVSSLDALFVVNRLREINNRGAGEQVLADPASGPAAAAVTSGFASASVAGLPLRNIQQVIQLSGHEPTALAAGPVADPGNQTGPEAIAYGSVGVADPLSTTDQIMSLGLEIIPTAADEAIESAINSGSDPASNASDTDAALSDVLDDFRSSPPLGLD